MSLYTSLIKRKGFKMHLRVLRKTCRDVLPLKLTSWMGTLWASLALCRNFKKKFFFFLSAEDRQAGYSEFL